jgi:two-component system LytT family sensor kinase
VKRHIYILIPLLISIAIPGIGFIISEETTKSAIPFGFQWAYTSIFLFVLWQLLSYSWKLHPFYKQIIYLILGIFLFIILVSIFSKGIGVRTSNTMEIKDAMRIVFLVLIFLTIQYGLNSQKRIETLKTEKEKLQKENYMAQLQSLRSQMDPHFLFNSLNTLRSMVHQNHKNSEEFILNLSNFYRSTLQHKTSNTLSLKEELSFLNSYLELMKSRNDEAIRFSIPTSDPDFSKYHLPSFGLQSVVENCFKHNSMSSKLPLNIRITVTDDYYIQVSNNIQEKLNQQQGSGVGLDLLKRRYKLLGWPDGVVVTKSKEEFTVKLKLITSS